MVMDIELAAPLGNRNAPVVVKWSAIPIDLWSKIEEQS